jgi:hypothetical protein
VVLIVAAVVISILLEVAVRAVLVPMALIESEVPAEALAVRATAPLLLALVASVVPAAIEPLLVSLARPELAVPAGAPVSAESLFVAALVQRAALEVEALLVADLEPGPAVVVAPLVLAVQAAVALAVAPVPALVFVEHWRLETQLVVASLQVAPQ